MVFSLPGQRTGGTHHLTWAWPLCMYQGEALRLSADGPSLEGVTSDLYLKLVTGDSELTQVWVGPRSRLGLSRGQRASSCPHAHAATGGEAADGWYTPGTRPHTLQGMQVSGGSQRASCPRVAGVGRAPTPLLELISGPRSLYLCTAVF